MSKIVTKLRELRNADVRYISLVDRSASRIPLRVVKRDEEGIDLSTLITKHSAEETVIPETKKMAKAEIVSIVVPSPANESVLDQIRQSIAEAGFNTERIHKADKGAVVLFPQSDSSEETTLIRLSDSSLLVMKGFETPEDNIFTKIAKAQNFYPGMADTLQLLEQKMESALGLEAGLAAKEMGTLLNDFHVYSTALLEAVPVSAIKADAALQTIQEEAVSEAKKVDSATLEGLDALLAQAPKHIAENDWGAMSPIDKIKWVTSWMHDNPPSAGPAQNENTKKAEGEGMKATGGTTVVEKEGKFYDGDGDECESNGKKKAAKKSDSDTILEAIAGLKTEFNTKIAEITTKFDSQQKVVDGLVEKSDNLSEKLATTVVASAKPEDTPAGDKGGVKKSDDFRTGCFDTAFLPKRRNR